MPKRKPADVNVEPAAESRKRAPAPKPAPAAKPKTAAAATHKRTTRKAAAESAPVAATPAVSLPQTEPKAPETAITATVQPPKAAIAALAYSYWEARGYQHGDPLADWVRAERELTELAQYR